MFTVGRDDEVPRQLSRPFVARTLGQSCAPSRAEGSVPHLCNFPAERGARRLP